MLVSLFGSTSVTKHLTDILIWKVVRRTHRDAHSTRDRRYREQPISRRSHDATARRTSAVRRRARRGRRRDKKACRRAYPVARGQTPGARRTAARNGTHRRRARRRASAITRSGHPRAPSGEHALREREQQRHAHRPQQQRPRVRTTGCLGRRLTHVTDGDDSAKNRVSAGGGG